MPCFFGSVALEKSKLMGWKIYESNWISQNRQYKQAFRMFIERSTKPIHLVAYKVFLLNLNTFLKVRKITFSYKKNPVIFSFLLISDSENRILAVCSIKKRLMCFGSNITAEGTFSQH